MGSVSDADWDDEDFLAELERAVDAASASRNPNPTPAPSPAPATAPAPISYLPAASASAPISYLPAASPSAPISYLPAASASAHISYLPAASASAASYNRSSPSAGAHPREFTQRPPLPLPPAASGDSYALATVDRGHSPPRELSQRPPLSLPPAASGDGYALAKLDRGHSPPRELSQRPTTEKSDCTTVGLPGPAVGDRLMGTGANMDAKREREAREVERLKKELNRVSKKMNDLKNECSELKKDSRRKEIQIKAREAEIENLRKTNEGFAGKDVCGVGTNTDQPVHFSANGAFHAVSTWASTGTDKSNGKVKDPCSLQEDLCLEQRHQTDLPQALELKDHTMIDNTTSTSGGLCLEENPHLEPRTVQCKEIKAMGVQTDNTWDSEHLDCKKVLLERISSNLRAIWGMPTNNLLGRNMISKIIVSCSEEILALLQCTRLPDKSGTSSETSSSLNDAISQLYDIFVKMSNEKIPIQTFLEALLNLCYFENAAVVGRTLRILHRILQHLLNYGTESNRSVDSRTIFLLNHLWACMWRKSIKTALRC